MEFQKMTSLLHGGDYNADQWLDRPDILNEDIRLMKEACVNVVTLGVFSWSSLEPQEGIYTFDWLDEIMDSMYQNGIHVILATPSGGKPPWLGKKYPEVMRTNQNRIHSLYGERENQCNSSPVFRDKIVRLDQLLAERYAHHPALIMWHISNEMYGECHCELCQQNFRKWLKNKYGSINELNKQYWSHFWSHTYQDWSELESPAPHGETAVHGLRLDYQEFYSDLTIDLMKLEIDTVKKYNMEMPVTHNMFNENCGYDYTKMSKLLDVTSWDCYPEWHCKGDKNSEWEQAVSAAFRYDLCRSLKNKPFLLMESTPSTTNGQQIGKLKRPRMHMLASMEAIASGADSVQYFQWRKSRGAYEKFHGAVISHNGSGDTRVFRDVCDVGKKLGELSFLKNTVTKSEVAVIYDWKNICALEEQKNLRREGKEFVEIVKEHYEAILKNYTSVDIISQDMDYSGYKLVIAPMLYLFKEKTSERIRDYIAKGGTFVITYYSGLVNENDLVYEGYSPYSLNDVFGVKVEEIDSLCDEESNEFVYRGRKYYGYYYCELADACGANVLSEYNNDFYAGKPVLTKNKFEQGNAFYLACRTDKEFLYDFYHDLIVEKGINRILDAEFVQDIMVKERKSGEKSYRFYMNFSTRTKEIAGHHLNGYGFEVEEVENN